MNNTEISEQQLIEFQTRMQNILDPLNQISNLQANKTAWEQQFNNNKFAKFTLAKNKKDSTILGAVVGGVLFMYVGLSLISVVNNKILAFITIAFICIVIGIITKLIYFSSQESKRKIGEKITNNSTQNIAEINRRINQLLTQYGNEIVALLPPDYQYYIAANYIYSCFLNGRAFTMSQAINLYEEQVHRWKIENYQQQMVNIQQQQQATMRAIKTNTAISAGASVANLFL